MDKELKAILREAETRGWRFERRSKHIIGKHIDGVRRTTISFTASDYRAIKNVKRYLEKR